MDIRNALLRGHSKQNTLAIVEYIGDDRERFAELMRVFFSGTKLHQQRAAWVISVVAATYPDLIRKYLSRLADQLPRRDVHDAVKRNIVRLLQFVPIPDRLKGKIYSHCLDLIGDPQEAIGVKAFAISVAASIAKNEPALMKELRSITELIREDASPGVKVRLREIY